MTAPRHQTSARAPLPWIYQTFVAHHNLPQGILHIPLAQHCQASTGGVAQVASAERAGISVPLIVQNSLGSLLPVLSCKIDNALIYTMVVKIGNTI
jgi:hypothetical protein